MILVNSKFDLVPSHFDIFKIIFFVDVFFFKFCYCVLYGTNVMYLTPQNMFLENMKY